MIINHFYSFFNAPFSSPSFSLSHASISERNSLARKRCPYAIFLFSLCHLSLLFSLLPLFSLPLISLMRMGGINALSRKEKIFCYSPSISSMSVEGSFSCAQEKLPHHYLWPLLTFAFPLLSLPQTFLFYLCIDGTNRCSH